MFLLLVCFSFVIQNEGASSVSYAMHVSRKSKSQDAPFESGYVYSKVDNKPGDLSTYEARDRRNILTDQPDRDLNKSTSSQRYGTLDSILPIVGKPSVDYDMAEAKANAKYGSKFYPSKIKSDLLYERLKSVMHYTPPEDSLGYDINSGYAYPDRFYADDNDVRTGSRSAYDSWPYYYGPYEYEKIKAENDMDSSKNKRYVNSDHGKIIIPVYEHVDEDVPFKQEIPFVTPAYTPITPTSLITSPPYVPVVNNDEDSLTFSGFDFNDHIDYKVPTADSSRNRRLDNHYKTYDYYPVPNHKLANSLGHAVTEKAYSKNHEYDNYKNGLDKKTNHKESYEHAGKNQKDFKEFTDAFKNRYGAEDQKRKSHVAVKHNQDKGEKRKGFRRVYHKDEYQEDNEFYDNNNHTINGEDAGSSFANLGGSDAYLHSLANAAAGSEGAAVNRLGSAVNSAFEHGDKGHERVKGYHDDGYRYLNGYYNE